MVGLNDHIVSESSQNKLYKILIERYSLSKNRNDEIVARGQNLLGFISIINTILVGFLVSIASNKDARHFIESANYFFLDFKMIIIFTFVFYFISILFTIKVIRITKYTPVPQINSKDFINDYFAGNTNLSIPHISLQLFDAIESYDKSNLIKYDQLSIATTFLLIAILLTTLSGIIMISMLGTFSDVSNTINCSYNLTIKRYL